jgi:hypothetical protein
MVKQIAIELTKRGYPALWEEGGGMSRRGHALIVAGPNGEPLKPIFVKTGGPLALGKHALFILREGCYIISLQRWGHDYCIQVYRVMEIDTGNKVANVEQICEFSQGEWDQDPPDHLLTAIEAAKEKSNCYHCRSSHYMLDP